VPYEPNDSEWTPVNPRPGLEHNDKYHFEPHMPYLIP